jgi:hypothetical protein
LWPLALRFSAQSLEVRLKGRRAPRVGGEMFRYARLGETGRLPLAQTVYCQVSQSHSQGLHDMRTSQHKLSTTQAASLTTEPIHHVDAQAHYSSTSLTSPLSTVGITGHKSEAPAHYVSSASANAFHKPSAHRSGSSSFWQRSLFSRDRRRMSWLARTHVLRTP